MARLSIAAAPPMMAQRCAFERSAACIGTVLAPRHAAAVSLSENDCTAVYAAGDRFFPFLGSSLA
jgi:hypothetical protein